MISQQRVRKNVENSIFSPDWPYFRVQVQITRRITAVPWKFLLHNIRIIKNSEKHQMTIIRHPNCRVWAKNFLCWIKKLFYFKTFSLQQWMVDEKKFYVARINTHPRIANQARHYKLNSVLRFWLFYMTVLILVLFCNKCRNCRPSR